jgi:hypothetical protein
LRPLLFVALDKERYNAIIFFDINQSLAGSFAETLDVLLGCGIVGAYFEDLTDLDTVKACAGLEKGLGAE